MNDWYPRNAEVRLAWHVNFNTKLVESFAAKYGITADVMAQIQEDLNWMGTWVPLRSQTELFKQQLTKYFNDIAGKDVTLDKPTDPVMPEIDSSPPVPPPGIESRVREVARQIKNHVAYSVADGEALGIVSPEATERNEADMVPEYTVRTLPNFQLEATFRRHGMDALKFQFRHIGGEWQSAGFLLTSPGTLTFTPKDLGVAQQIEVRATFMRKNSEVGIYSDAKSAFIAP